MFMINNLKYFFTNAIILIITSQNLTKYNFPIPDDAIFRINLAWVNSIRELSKLLEKHKSHKIFLDLPVNRTKLPNNKYSIDEIIPLFNKYENIKYFAISNIEKSDDLRPYVDVIPKSITIIPKIESPNGVNNIKEITDIIPSQEKIIMLDHDDLYSNMIKENQPPSKFKDHMENLVAFCSKQNIVILRTIGVVFSDVEKRITEYIG